MNIGDLINGLFEFVGAIFVILHILRLTKDKEVKGVSVVATAYFTSWGVWNVYFYPTNNLIFSFVGGVFLATANIVYVTLLIYYNGREERRRSPVQHR
jgi:hypothetical protein